MQRCLGCMREFNSEYDVCPHCGYIVGTGAEATNYLAPGTILQNRYTIGKALGQGGFGITYIAWDNKIDRAVAIKEYMPNAFATRMTGEKSVSCYNAEAKRQFDMGLVKTQQETRALSQFDDLESVVKVYDCVEENGTAYIIMELLRGRTARDVLAQRGKLTLDETMRIMTPVLQTLEAMHRIGMIHRDVAPDNIFVCDNGKVKLLDFGAARVVSGTDNRTLSVMLKHGYAPMEQYSGKARQGAFTDVYAASATIYKMLTGQTPPDSLDREADGSDLAALASADVPPAVQKVILHGMAQSASERIQTAQELLRQLQDAQSGGNGGNNDDDNGKKKRIILIAAVLAVIALVVVLVVSLSGNRDTDTDTGTTAETSTTVHETVPETTQTTTAPTTTQRPVADPSRTIPVVTVTSSGDQGSGKYGRSYKATMAVDGDFNTCWMVASDDSGRGNWIQLDFGSPRTVSGIELINGNGWNGYHNGQKVEDGLYDLNGRIKDFVLSFSDGSSLRYTAADLREEQFGANIFYFDQPVTTQYVRLYIESGYAGSKWTSVACLSEIAAF